VLPALAWPRTRARLLRDWTTWLQATALVFALCAPWFIYSHIRFGMRFWETILGEHVFKRMTSFLDPAHVHPWNWYFQEMWYQFNDGHVAWLIVAGLLVLLVQSFRRRWFEGAVILVWAVVPICIISAGTSKLYHYTFPYLPPLALAAGYLVALVTMLAPAPLGRALDWCDARLTALLPGVMRVGARPSVRRAVAALTVLAAVLAIWASVTGGVRIQWAGKVLFKSAGVLRPVALILVLSLLTRTTPRVVRLVVALLVLGAMPLDAYRGQLQLLPGGEHPIRTAAECVQRVHAGLTGTPPGLFIDIPEGIWHPIYYYFRRVPPVVNAETPLDPALDQLLRDPNAARPALVGDSTWRAFKQHARETGEDSTGILAPPMVGFLNTVLLLPGPYAACSSEAALRTTP
jgi:hypothetical protein